MTSVSNRPLNPRGAAFADYSDLSEEEPLSPVAAQTAWAVFAALAAVLVVAYWDMLVYTSSFWTRGEYSHGWIVPLCAGYLFWLRKRPLAEATAAERWAGVAIIAASLTLRGWASIYDYNNPDRISFITALLGVCLIVGGKSMLRWAGPALAFLLLMFPLPAILESTMLFKLQAVATAMSTLTLQFLGVSAAKSGNVISIDTLKEPLQVAEACSGLRMLTIFGAMIFALILIIDRPWWDKLVIFLSWVPIALVSNMIRIVSTALLYMLFGQENEWLNWAIHGGAGLAMMPIGLGLLWVEMAILSRLTIPIETEDFGSLGSRHGHGGPVPAI